MLEQQQRSQILKFSRIFHWNKNQEATYVRRVSNHLAKSSDFDKDFILWSKKNWRNLIQSSPHDDHFLNWLIKHPQEEASVVFWHQIMKFPEETICRSMNLSPGTFRFRLSRGLCSLGKKL